MHTSSSKADDNAARVFTDVILTIKPQYAELIRKREKNHEFRQYKLRPSVSRLWLYESAPRCAIICMIETVTPKVPGELRDPGGVGNDAFDAGAMTKYAYPVRGVRKLREPITRADLKTRFGVASPRGFCYATKQMVLSIPVDEMEELF